MQLSRSLRLLFTFLCIGILITAFFGCTKTLEPTELIQSSPSSSVPLPSDRETLPAAINGDYIQLHPEEEINTNFLGSVLEFADRILCLSYEPQGSDFYTNYSIESFDLKSGDSVYTFGNELYAQYGMLYRMDKCSEQEGYDYRMVFENCMVYRNSAEQDKEMVFKLPKAIKPVPLEDPQPKGFFDVNENHIVWTDTDGIWIADKNGNNSRCILPNDQLATDYPDYSSTIIMYGNPRFISKGSKVAAGVFRVDDSMYFSVVTYDLAVNAVDNRITMMIPDAPVYPIEDRYIAVKGSSGSQILDVQTGTISDYRLEGRNHPLFSTYDYKVMVTARYNSMDFDGLKAYICSVGQPDDDSRLLLSVQDDSIVYFRAITQNYVLFSNSESQWIAIAKYR